MKEYKVVIYREGIFSSVLFGSAKLNPKRFTDFLNEHAADGWRVVTMKRFAVCCCFGSVRHLW